MSTLRVNHKAAQQPKGSGAQSLLLKNIHTDEAKFQWRLSSFNKMESDGHIRTLIRALNDTGEPLEPLLVVRVEGKFCVVDGHHRREAYRAVRWKKPIPVVVFAGTIEEARHAALAGNIRDKLRLSEPEKKEAAWRLVKEGKLSIADTVKRGVASGRTVSAMRAVLKKLLNNGTDPAGLSWIKARMVGQEGLALDADDWRMKKAQKIVAALIKAKIGQGLAKDPSVTALALQMLNATLPGALVRQWWMDDPDLKMEIAEEFGIAEAIYGFPQADDL